MIKRTELKEFSFAYSLILFLIPLLFFTIGQILNKPINISFILIMNISTIILIPIIYYFINNKSFNTINSNKFIVKLIPIYALFMIIIFTILYFLGYIVI